MKKKPLFNMWTVWLLLVCTLCFSCKKEDVQHPVDTLVSDEPDRALPYIFADWMSGIPDNTNLCRITIPGTHDCAADEHSGGVPGGSHWDVVCQDFRFSNQLLLGVRWFDVRYDDQYNRLEHGCYILSRSLDDIIGDALSFLSAHPTETVIFMIKKEFSTSSDGTFSDKVWSILNKYDLNKFYLSDIQPLIGQVRGKIVIATHGNTNLNGHPLGMSFSWTDNSSLSYNTYSNYRYYVQDHYSLNTVDYSTKCNDIKNLLNISYNEPDYGRFDLNFTSGEKDGYLFTSNKTVADNINGVINDFLISHVDWRHLGVIFVNYAGGSDDGRCCWNFVKTIIQHNDFESVKIGSQVWAGKDLDVTTYRDGTPIPKVQDAAAWSNLTTGAYSEDEYGKHYNWYAVNDSRGLAPAGWRIPTEADWDFLVNTVGGANIAGQALKVCGNLNWWNDHGQDVYLFAALPTGYRDAAGTFQGFGSTGTWWCSTGANANDAIFYWMYYDNDKVQKFTDSKKMGMTVRCIKE